MLLSLIQEKKCIDYYPGGIAMPNRQLIEGEPYRYEYQGNFAETDPETGKPAFELRLYDAGINIHCLTRIYMGLLCI